MTEESRISGSLHRDMGKQRQWPGSQFERSARSYGVRFWFHKHFEGMIWLYLILFPHCSQGTLKGTALH